MKMAENATLLSGAGNYAVVHVAGRRFPGIVLQGDSLFALWSQVKAIERKAAPKLAVSGAASHQIDALWAKNERPAVAQD